MKSNKVPKRLQAIFDVAGVTSVKKVVPIKGALDKAVILEVRKHYRNELTLCGQMFRIADKKEAVVTVCPGDPLWAKNGLHLLRSEERRLIRRLCERDGYSTSFTQDGLLISQRVERIHPVATPVALAC